MSRLADLEAMVQAAWTRGTQAPFGRDSAVSREGARTDLRALLAVYADELQQLGDPRGELVALDLFEAPDRARIAELRRQWLGPLATHPNVTLRYGLVGVAVTDADAALLQEVFASPAGRYVSSVSMFGDPFTVRAALAAIARELRPWLGALRVFVPVSPAETTVISEELAARVIAATPALYALSLGGVRLLHDFPHPTLRRLVVEGADALAALHGHGEPLPSVSEIDLAFQLSGAPVAEISLVDLLPASHLPALRSLDLAHNERMQPLLFRWLRASPITRQLARLRLPALRTLQDRDLVQSIIDQVPTLEELHVTKVYGRSADGGARGLRHARASLVIPPAVPWLESAGRATITHGDEAGLFSVEALIAAMERVYEMLPVEARVIWDDWWAAIVTFEQTSQPFSFAARDLAAALDACGDALADAWWRDLATRLRSADGEVTVSRFTMPGPAPG